ncbi:MAG: hypothetical protein HeimC3_34360 [Candidatus Heimdallarchaeota archaeon LC_3]|nr:MAG: hypothetical protein HeimC3_34360 [Candidatus Heimdallarchaeota archaeon LC_3]
MERGTGSNDSRGFHGIPLTVYPGLEKTGKPYLPSTLTFILAVLSRKSIE